MSSEQIEQAALADGKVQVAIKGKQVVKIIVVPKKLVNIVVR
jgi:leucyl-tRNA synthetase